MTCRNHVVLQENAQHVTRFIALAAVNNPAKKKVHTRVVCLSGSLQASCPVTHCSVLILKVPNQFK